MNKWLLLLAALLASGAQAELRGLDDADLAEVNGQAGMSLSATLRFNKNPANTRCNVGGATGGCGTRIALNFNGGPGFLVIDNLSGAFSFDGALLDVVRIDSSGGFGTESAASGTQAVRISLTNGRFDNYRWTLAGSNRANPVPGDATFKQTDLLTYQTNGQVKLQGNVYVFGVR